MNAKLIVLTCFALSACEGDLAKARREAREARTNADETCADAAHNRELVKTAHVISGKPLSKSDLEWTESICVQARRIADQADQIAKKTEANSPP